jgi:L-threonylcarbamoyladenylate synthase
MPQISLLEMARALKVGPALVSFPTDTVPALATCPQHTHLIYIAKRRPLEKPLILMGASFDDLLPYVAGSAAELNAWRAVAEQHWPGQLTLVLPAMAKPSKGIANLPATLNPQNSNTDLHTLGIRVPNHPIALELLAQTGPLATTSANVSGQPPLLNQLDIARTFPTALTLSAEAFKQDQGASGMPSTVAKWTGHDWEILRQGKIQL